MAFARATSETGRTSCADPEVEAVVHRSRPSTPTAPSPKRPYATRQNSVFCEKHAGRPRWRDARALTAAAEAAGVVHMIGLQLCPARPYHAIRPPPGTPRAPSRGHVVSRRTHRGFPGRSETPANWRTKRAAERHDGRSGAAHDQLRARHHGPHRGAFRRGSRRVHPTRPGPDGPAAVDNDDHAQMMVCASPRAPMGHLYFSRAATGPQRWAMPYEIQAARKARSASDQEDLGPGGALPQARTPSNSTGPRGRRRRAASRRIPDGDPAHPDTLPSVRGRGIGTVTRTRSSREGARLPSGHRPRMFRHGPASTRASPWRKVIETAFLSNDTGAMAACPARLKGTRGGETKIHDQFKCAQCALFMGCGIRGRPAQSAMALGPQGLRRGGLYRHRAGARGLHCPRIPRSCRRRWTSTGSS